MKRTQRDPAAVFSAFVSLAILSAAVGTGLSSGFAWAVGKRPRPAPSASVTPLPSVSVSPDTCPPLPPCPAPPENCGYGQFPRNEQGCIIGCGSLICKKPPADEEPVPCVYPPCPAPPEGCSYRDVPQDQNGCPTSCGTLFCKDSDRPV